MRLSGLSWPNASVAVLSLGLTHRSNRLETTTYVPSGTV